MKFHWGHGIASAALLFVAFISMLVWRSMQEKVDFVTDAYYEKELVYQKHIDSEENALALGKNVAVEFHEDTRNVIVAYPEGFSAPELSGRIEFYRADDSGLDFSVPVESDASLRQLVSATGLKKGMWKVMVNWTARNKPYYFEKKLFIN